MARRTGCDVERNGAGVIAARHTLRNVLVTGGAGFIGSNFIGYLLSARPRVRVVNFDKLTYAGDLANLEDVPQDGRYRFVQGDICDRDLLTYLLAVENIETVVHFAAESHVDRSIAGPTEFIRTNVQGTQALLDACRSVWKPDISARADVRFHQVSTDEVFGSLSADAAPFDETTAYAPNSPYSASKAAADHLVCAYAHTYGIPALITHCSNNYGARQHPEKFIPTIIWAALTGQPIPVYGKGANIRDWLFVEDHCQGLLFALESAADGRRYCLGSGQEFSNIGLARRICGLLDEARPEAAPHDRLITFVADRPGHDFRYAINARRIGAELGWVPATDIAAGLRRTIAWYMARWTTAQYCRVHTASDDHPGDGADLPPQYLPGHAIQKRA
jgi:dTDP-glucose 4,6-dehydratase